MKRAETMATAGPLEVSRTRRWAVLATILLGTMLATLASSILNLSVTPIMAEFRADLRTVEWVLTSYNLAFAVFTLGLGSLGDTVGRRRLYILGQAIFVAGSGLVAVATGLWPLIGFRAIQGLGAAALAPNALALIRDHFPEGERGSALGIWGAAAGLSAALGPTVGGIVAQGWGWRALFLINVPLGLLATAAAYTLLAPDPRWRQQQFDVHGFVTLAAALLALSVSVLGVSGVESGWVRGGFAGLTLLFGTWFVLVERRAPAPLVDLAAILRRSVITANLAVFFALLVMSGGMFLSVLYAQLLAGSSTAAIGLLLAPCAAATFLIAPVGGRLADKVGPRTPAVAGLLGLVAAVTIPIGWHPASAGALVFWSNLLVGTSLGLAAPALTRAATESVPEERAGLGAGIYSTVTELGAVFGIALLGGLLETRIVANALRQIPSHFLPQELSLKAVTSLEVLERHALQKGLALQDLAGFHRALIQAVQQGFDQVFRLAALLAGLGVLAGLLIPRRLGPERG